jgi:hypothetical protein
LSDKRERVGSVVQHAKGDTDTLIGECILFAHIISGGATTSRMYGVRKHLVFKKQLGDSKFRKHAEIFWSGPYTQYNKITEAGEKAIVSLYN